MSEDTKEKLPPAWNSHGKMLPGRQSLNPGGKSKWVKDFQVVFRDRLAERAAAVLERVMDRALNTEDIEAQIALAQQQEQPEVFVRLEAEKNERYKQATNAAGHALKYILPAVKPDSKPTQEDKDGADALRGMSAAQLLALSRLKEKDSEH